jgi:hypothetical protein
LRELRKTATEESWLRIGWEFLETMGLYELVGCDIDLMPILEQIPPGSEFIDVQCFLQHRVVEELLEKLDAGGSTLFLNPEKMKGTPAEALVPHIVELRRKELSNLQIPVLGKEIVIYNLDMEEIATQLIPDRGKPVLLEPLWMTALGREILSSLGMGLRTNMYGLKKVQRALRRIGVRAQPVQRSKAPGRFKSGISDAMRILLLRQIQQGS